MNNFKTDYIYSLFARLNIEYYNIFFCIIWLKTKKKQEQQIISNPGIKNPYYKFSQKNVIEHFNFWPSLTIND